MADDKEIRIRFDTEADLKGAKDTKEAIEDVKETVETIGETPIVIPDAPGGGTNGTSVALEEIVDDAQDAKVALDGVTDAAEEATSVPPGPTAEVVEDVGKEAVVTADKLDQVTEAVEDIGTAAPEVQRTGRSIRDLAAEVNRLEDELETLPVGSAAFTAMAGRVATARKELTTARQQADQLAGTMRRSGNAGGAVLEFSRAFEDAQYGIRGVLNNIPGLIAMLGGSAGLAGVISVVAVAGNLLWEKFVKGPKDAAKEAKSYADILKATQKVYEDIIAVDADERAKVIDARARQLAQDLASLDFGSKLAANKAGQEALRIESEKRVALARQQLALAQLEAGVTKISLTDANAMAAERKRITEETIRIEQEAAERTRQLELSNARRTLADAQGRADAIRNSPSAVQADSDARQIQGEINELRKAATASQELRTGMIEMLRLEQAETQKIVDDIRSLKTTSGDVATDSGNVARGEAKIDALTRMIGEFMQVPEAERNATAQAEALREKLKEPLAALAEVAKQESAAAAAVKDAMVALANVKQTQFINRDAERQLADLSSQSREVAAGREVEQRAGDATKKLLDEILAKIAGGADRTDVRPIVDRINQIVADGLQKGEVDQATAALLQLQAKMEQGNADSRAAYQKILANQEAVLGFMQNVNAQFDQQRARTDELTRGLNQVRAQQGQRNF